ncbi:MULTISPECIES: MerR family DNA-binding protein [Nocardia]|uniref:MerR family DNA-binding protein n=1 Tax=Nocardia TaxID=1817 RepID=UPI001E5EC92F|nr:MULTISPECIES: MerR family DNA-binding protein [Nocardia]
MTSSSRSSHCPTTPDALAQELRRRHRYTASSGQLRCAPAAFRAGAPACQESSAVPRPRPRYCHDGWVPWPAGRPGPLPGRAPAGSGAGGDGAAGDQGRPTRLGFTLDEVTELLEATRYGHRRTDAGLQARAATELAEIDTKLAELTAVRDTLLAALAAGCDDLLAYSESPCWPIPFNHNDPTDAKNTSEAGGRCGC